MRVWDAARVTSHREQFLRGKRGGVGRRGNETAIMEHDDDYV